MNYKVVDLSEQYDGYALQTYEIKTRIGTQTLEMTVQEDVRTRDTIYWYVSMSLYSKRKQCSDNFDYIKSTGKGTGIKALLQAKETLAWFESKIKYDYPDYNNVMVIQWIDKRRKKIYTRKLKDVGYNMSVYQHKEALIKRL